jgi:branched-chain amino acid aminotransferase
LIMQFLLDQRFVAEEDARISVSDRGFLYGDAAFDTLCAYGGRVFRASAHLQRLMLSLSALRIEPPCALGQMEDDLSRVLERNDVRDAILRIAVSRGSGARGPRIRGVSSPTYLIACYAPGPAGAAAPSVKLEQVGVRRTPTESLPAHAKTANYLNSILALAEAADADADEALLLDMRGYIAECAYSNVFFVTSKALLTPAVDAGILPGITRAAVLELAHRHRIAVRETSLEPSIALEADEAFITNSVRGVVPVHAIGTRTYPAPGPVTARMQQLYWDLVEREAGPRWA